jgi:hypothetical protein
LALGTQILPQSFQILGDSARLLLDSWVRVRSGPVGSRLFDSGNEIG